MPPGQVLIAVSRRDDKGVILRQERQSAQGAGILAAWREEHPVP